MVVGALVLVVLIVGAIWYVVARGRDADLVTERDFEAGYEGDGESAWEEFHDWQVRNEAERRSWEDPDDG